MVYNSFENLLKAINTHAVAKSFAFAIKHSKKSKKQILHKVWPEYDKSKAKRMKPHGRKEVFESHIKYNHGKKTR